MEDVSSYNVSYVNTADAVTTDAKKTKNIDYSIKQSPEVSSKGGLQIKSISATSDGNRLKIRKRK